MNIYKLNDFIKGWFIGNFKPSIIQKKDFEIALKYYQKGDKEKNHYHKKATEFTIIVNGKFKLNGKVFKKGDIIEIQPNETADFICIKSGANVVLKVPSVKNDKFFK